MKVNIKADKQNTQTYRINYDKIILKKSQSDPLQVILLAFTYSYLVHICICSNVSLLFCT